MMEMAKWLPANVLLVVIVPVALAVAAILGIVSNIGASKAGLISAGVFLAFLLLFQPVFSRLRRRSES